MNIQLGWTRLLDTKQDPLNLGKSKSRGLRSETSYRLMRSLSSRHFGRRKILGVLFLAGGADFSLYKAHNLLKISICLSIQSLVLLNIGDSRFGVDLQPPMINIERCGD